MINKSKLNYIKLITNYIIKNYKDKIKYIIIFGDSINPTIKNPASLDIAIAYLSITFRRSYGTSG